MGGSAIFFKKSRASGGAVSLAARQCTCTSKLHQPGLRRRAGCSQAQARSLSQIPPECRR